MISENAFLWFFIGSGITIFFCRIIFYRYMKRMKLKCDYQYERGRLASYVETLKQFDIKGEQDKKINISKLQGN